MAGIVQHLCAGQDPFLTGTVHVSELTSPCRARNDNLNIFESLTRAKQFARSGAQMKKPHKGDFFICAPNWRRLDTSI